MKRNKHNKKRNTAFLYEALVREMTKSIISGDKDSKKAVIGILKESFAPNMILAREMELYKAILETNDVDTVTAEKIVYHVRQAHEQMDSQEIYEAQSHLIKRINKELSSGVYNNFVPNYKNLATVAQLFDMDTEEVNVKAAVLLEQKVVSRLTQGLSEKQESKMKPIDNLVFSTFVSKYNETYSDEILVEQRELLNRYIFSFSDNNVDISVYLNEELNRLHDILSSAIEADEIATDETMVESTKSVICMIEQFRQSPVDKAMVEKVLKIQNLAHEIEVA